MSNPSEHSLPVSFSTTLKYLIEQVFETVSTVEEQQVDFKELIKLIHCHRLAALAQHRINPSDLQVKEELDQIYYFNKIEQLRSLAELIRIDLKLKDVGVEIMPIKGHILSQLLYADPTERTSRDIDILLKPADVIKSIEVLQQNGYHLDTLFDTNKQREAILKHYHNLELRNKEEGFTIEVHWRLSASRSFRFDLEKIWNHGQTIEIGETRLRLMRKDDLLAYLCLHGMMHSYFRLHWLADVNNLLNKLEEQEFDQIRKELVGSELEIYFISTLYLLHKIANYPLSPEIETAISKNRSRVIKLYEIAVKEIAANNFLTERPRDIGSRIKRTWHHHRLQFLTGGVKAFFKSIFGRNVRPQNWKIFVFPDSIFFLNHLFSRIIWVFGKLSGRI